VARAVIMMAMDLKDYTDVIHDHIDAVAHAVGVGPILWPT
jgi:hypothetical protein